MSKFEIALTSTLRNEGSFVNHKDDQGGPTNFGISLRFYKQKVNPNADIDDIRYLRVEEASNIYKEFFWDRQQYDLITDQPLAGKTFDLAVNLGPNTANSLLQKAVNALKPSVNLVIDGYLGPKSFAAINNSSAKELYIFLIKEAFKHYNKIAGYKNNQAFLRGWLNRLHDVC